MPEVVVETRGRLKSPSPVTSTSGRGILYAGGLGAAVLTRSPAVLGTRSAVPMHHPLSESKLPRYNL